MKIIAFVFSRAPHGTSFGREGIDAVLGVSVLMKKISLFFIGDGILQLFQSCNTEKILSRDYVPSFSILSLYNIHRLYCCQSSLIERGFTKDMKFVLNITFLDTKSLHKKLNIFDTIINF